jgi:hypothetical protein
MNRQQQMKTKKQIEKYPSSSMSEIKFFIIIYVLKVHTKNNDADFFIVILFVF